MSISYHGIIGFGSGKATLPSVESWGGNMNILRDPPASKFTRKIDKVGATSEITQMIQDSGDRACEAINVYARGVNPMVAVDYGNYGNNGGQRRGNRSSAGMVDGSSNSGKQSYLPYRIMNHGAFRPPVRDQRENLPLSRLPRVWTSTFTQPGFTDFSKKAMMPSIDDQFRAVKNPDRMLKACVRPTATYKIETPITEGYEVKNVIKNPIQISGNSRINPHAWFNGEKGDVSNGIHEQVLKPDVNMNRSGEYSREVDVNMDTERYTQDVLKGKVDSNVSSNRHVTPIQDLMDFNPDDMVKETFNIDHTSVRKGYDKYEYMHDDVKLDRVLPQYQAKTNVGRNIHKRTEHDMEREYVVNRPTTTATTNVGGSHMRQVDNIMNREYNLKPTVNPGGFSPSSYVPSVNMENNVMEFDQGKADMRRKIYEMQAGRTEVEKLVVNNAFLTPNTPYDSPYQDQNHIYRQSITV
jgi:hypothetical protein